jgi:WD40 repeat protein
VTGGNDGKLIIWDR